MGFLGVIVTNWRSIEWRDFDLEDLMADKAVGWVERSFRRWVLRFWIADFGFPGNKSFFDKSEFSLAINLQ